MRPNARKFAAVITAVLLTGAACADDAEDAPATPTEGSAAASPSTSEGQVDAASVTAAAERTLGAGSAHAEVTIETEAPAGLDGGDGIYTATGEVDFDQIQSSLVYDFEQLLNGGGGLGAFSDLPVVVDGGTYSIELEQLGWLTLDFVGEPQQAIADIGQIRFLIAGDPSVGLRLLAAAENVESVGSEEVEGTPTLHVTTETSLAAAVSDGSASDLLEAARTSLDTKDVQVDAWISEEGLVLKTLVMAQVPVAVGEKQTHEYTFETVLSDLGDPVSIKVPSDTTPISELVQT